MATQLEAVEGAVKAFIQEQVKDLSDEDRFAFANWLLSLGDEMQDQTRVEPEDLSPDEEEIEEDLDIEGEGENEEE